MNSRVLIIEDNTEINNMISDYLTLNGYICTQAFSGTEGVLLARTDTPDVIIMDLMLPGKSGEQILPEIKGFCDAPVIVLSAKDSIDSKVDLLMSGAADYMTKPFDLKELEARILVSLRRSGHDAAPAGTQAAPAGSSSTCPPADLISYNGLEFSEDMHFLRVSGQPVELTKHEFAILGLFLKNPGRAFSKQAIYDYAWDDDYLGEDKTVNVHIGNIRKKLKALTDTEYIDTVWGIGFKLH